MYCVISEIELPEKTSEVGVKTSVIPENSPHRSPAKSVRTEATAASTMTLYSPPNMAEVYYSGSYEDYIRKKQCVEPKCICWTTKQAAYVGCGGGQLLTVEAESGSATLLVNPLPTEVSTQKIYNYNYTLDILLKNILFL